MMIIATILPILFLVLVKITTIIVIVVIVINISIAAGIIPFITIISIRAITTVSNIALLVI